MNTNAYDTWLSYVTFVRLSEPFTNVIMFRSVEPAHFGMGFLNHVRNLSYCQNSCVSPYWLSKIRYFVVGNIQSVTITFRNWHFVKIKIMKNVINKEYSLYLWIFGRVTCMRNKFIHAWLTDDVWNSSFGIINQTVFKFVPKKNK